MDVDGEKEEQNGNERWDVQRLCAPVFTYIHIYMCACVHACVRVWVSVRACVHL